MIGPFFFNSNISIIYFPFRMGLNLKAFWRLCSKMNFSICWNFLLIVCGDLDYWIAMIQAI